MQDMCNYSSTRSPPQSRKDCTGLRHPFSTSCDQWNVPDEVGLRPFVSPAELLSVGHAQRLVGL